MSGVPEVRKRRERGSISPEEILEGAFFVAQRDSLDNLSMTELAKHLGVGVTSLYWYYRKKDELIRAMCDEAITAVHDLLPNPTTASHWREFLNEYYVTMRNIYRGNDILADLVLVRTSEYSLVQTQATYEGVDRILRMLVSRGFRPIDAWRVNAALSVYTRGNVISERAQRLQKSPTLDARQSKLIIPETMPVINELYAAGSITLSMVTEEDFRFGLDMLLDSALRIHDEHHADAGSEGSRSIDRK